MCLASQKKLFTGNMWYFDMTINNLILMSARLTFTLVKMLRILMNQFMNMECAYCVIGLTRKTFHRIHVWQRHDCKHCEYKSFDGNTLGIQNTAPDISSSIGNAICSTDITCNVEGLTMNWNKLQRFMRVTWGSLPNFKTPKMCQDYEIKGIGKWIHGYSTFEM